MGAHSWIILMCERQEIGLNDFTTFFPSYLSLLNPYLSLLLNFFFFPFILLILPSTRKCIIIWYNTCIYSLNLNSKRPTQLNISSREYVPLGQSSRDWTTAALLLIFFIFMSFFFLFSLAGPEEWERVHQAETCPWQFLWRRASHLHQLQQERPVLSVGLDRVRVCVCHRLISVAFWRPAPIFLCFSFRQLTLKVFRCSPTIYSWIDDRQTMRYALD